VVQIDVVRRLQGRSAEITAKAELTLENDFHALNIPGSTEARRAVWYFKQHMNVKTCGVLVLNICVGHPVFSSINLDSFRAFMR
jgi:hypothetical protein